MYGWQGNIALSYVFLSSEVFLKFFSVTLSERSILIWQGRWLIAPLKTAWNQSSCQCLYTSVDNLKFSPVLVLHECHTSQVLAWGFTYLSTFVCLFSTLWFVILFPGGNSYVIHWVLWKCGKIVFPREIAPIPCLSFIWRKLFRLLAVIIELGFVNSSQLISQDPVTGAFTLSIW